MTVEGAMIRQLDLFADGRDVMLANEAVAALLAGDAGAAQAALTALAVEFPQDARLARMRRLLDWLARPLTAVDEATLACWRDELLPLAHRLLGGKAAEFARAQWRRLGAMLIGLTFDAGCETLHAAPCLLAAGDWRAARLSVEAIDDWRRRPAPLGWHIEALCGERCEEAIWPAFAELCWMAPRRAAALLGRLQAPALHRLVTAFRRTWSDEQSADDTLAWLPAWLLIEAPALADLLRQAQRGADSLAERGFWQVLGLMLLERQGRHDELIAGRIRLKALDAQLFALYMARR